MKTLNQSRKMASTLDHLTDLAREKKSELLYNFNRIQKAVKTNTRKAKRTVIAVDKDAHKKPWLFIGACAAGSLAAGYIFGAMQRRK